MFGCEAYSSSTPPFEYGLITKAGPRWPSTWSTPFWLDDFVLALGGARVAVRRLYLLTSPLETMFFALTSDGGGGIEDLAPEELAETVPAGA
ncbi:MAG TPA: hypothetical protein VHA76_06065 [Solirubrobacterales bacterium]|nr:hypothetical protein [Solirubrobacterales bacterium]